MVGQETGGGRGPSSKSSRGAAKYHDDEDEDEEEYGLDDETGGLTEEDEEAAFKHRRSKSQGAEPSSRAPAAQAKPSRTSARAAVRAAGDVLRRIGAEEAAGAVGSIPRGEHFFLRRNSEIFSQLLSTNLFSVGDFFWTVVRYIGKE